ncbi:Domain of unknown function DUF4325 [Spirosomataceae bacterium]
MTPNVINLQDYRTKGSRVFTGRDRGIEVREASNIDELEKMHSKVIVIIPEDIGSINPSFLEEFLLNVVSKLKENDFFEKFTFENNGRYKIKRDLIEAVDRILRDQNALVD